MVVGRPFPKGTSGNPGGRPKGISMSKVLTDELSVDEAREVIRAVLRLAKAGDMKAAALLWDRTDGKPAQTVEHSGPDGSALKIALKWEPNADD